MDLFVNTMASIIWCGLAIFLAWVARKISKKGNAYKTPLITGMALYGLSFVALLSNHDDETLFGVYASLLGIIALVIQFIRIKKEKEEDSAQIQNTTTTDTYENYMSSINETREPTKMKGQPGTYDNQSEMPASFSQNQEPPVNQTLLK